MIFDKYDNILKQEKRLVFTQNRTIFHAWQSFQESI